MAPIKDQVSQLELEVRTSFTRPLRPRAELLAEFLERPVSAFFTSSSRIFFSAMPASTRGCRVSRNRYKPSSYSRSRSTGNGIEVAVRRGEDDRDLLLDRSGWYCGCFRISVSRLPRLSCFCVAWIEVAAELRERRQLAVLREVEPQRCRRPAASP